MLIILIFLKLKYIIENDQDAIDSYYILNIVTKIIPA